MDRISRAVEKARRERQKTRDHQAVSTVELNHVDYIKTESVSLPKEYLRKNRIISKDDHDGFAHGYKSLRTRVWHKMKENGWNSLAVTSCRQGEGKTVTAINLCISLAMMKANHSILLVDLDLRRPGIQKHLGLNLSQGISDYLLEGVPLESILINPGISRFVILPGNKSIQNSSELLSSVRMEQMIQEFKNRYPSRLVVYDLPPILSADDALVILPHIDAVLLVVEEGGTQKEDLVAAAELLKDSNLLGTVLNKSREEQITYY